jgi:3-oxoacid CoA-transferase B subunit
MPMSESVIARTGRALSREELAARIARDLWPGATVNLGIGIPLLVADHIPADGSIAIHTENGLLGMGRAATGEEIDPDLIGAGKGYTTAVPGASVFDSSISFGMIRSGRLDVTVLGALEVSETGDLANWYVPGGRPGVGGAMDLVSGAREVWVATQHVDRAGTPKLVRQCRYPLTGRGVVTRVYTDLAVFEVRDGRLVLRELAPGVGADEIAAKTEAAFVTDLSG